MTLAEAVASLGATREEALAAFRARNIRCRSRAALDAADDDYVTSSCLVATYIKACGVEYVSCGAWTANTNIHSLGGYEFAHLPAHVADIIDAYDNGDPSLTEFYEDQP